MSINSDTEIDQQNNTVFREMIQNIETEFEDCILNEHNANKKSKLHYNILMVLLSLSSSIGVLVTILQIGGLSTATITNVLTVLQTFLGACVVFMINGTIDKASLTQLFNALKNSYSPIINDLKTKYAIGETTNVVNELDKMKTFMNVIDTIKNTFDSSVDKSKVEQIKQDRELKRQNSLALSSVRVDNVPY